MRITIQTNDATEAPRYCYGTEQITHFHATGAPFASLIEIETDGAELLGLYGQTWESLSHEDREAWAKWIEDEHRLDVRIAECDPAVRVAYESLVFFDLDDWESRHTQLGRLLTKIEAAYAFLRRNRERHEITGEEVIRAVEAKK